jgi:hypothetical protein
MLEPRWALALDREVTQKHPHGGDDHPRGVAPVVPTPLRDEVPQPAGRIRLRIVTQDTNEIPDIAPVRRQRALADAPIDPHPSEEALDPSSRLWSSLQRGHSTRAEVPEEPANARQNMSTAIA